MMSSGKLWAYVGVITVTAIFLALAIYAVPGLAPILIFGACWWVRPLPKYDLDAELAELLAEHG